MNIVFLGTPEFAATILQSLIETGHNILLAVTQPDKPVGRKRILEFSPVKKLALAHQIPVFQPKSLKKDHQTILNLNPDILITAAYGQMLPNILLDEIRSVNVHGSLLPFYRGGAPIQYALFDGLKETGITIMYMAYQMDSGDIIKQESIPILESDDYQSLSKRLAHLGAKLLNEVLQDISQDIIVRIPQDHNQATFAYTLKLEDEYIDFNQSADQIINRLRGLSPQPGGYANLKGNSIKLFKAQKSDIINNEAMPGTVLINQKKLVVATKDISIEILEIQVPGKKRLAVKDFLNGQNLILVGDVFERKP